jgi:hypothetical protein
VASLRHVRLRSGSSTSVLRQYPLAPHAWPLQIYMDPLVKRLGASPPLNLEVMPLIDTLIHLTVALGGNVEQYALPLLQHALATAAANLSAVHAAEACASDGLDGAAAKPAAGAPDGAVFAPAATPASEGTMYALPIVTYALDLISALIEVLKRSSHALLAAVGLDAVPNLALAAARCPNACVQQSAFALIGELANQVPSVVASCQGATMLHLCYELLDPERMAEVRPLPCSPATPPAPVLPACARTACLRPYCLPASAL